MANASHAKVLAQPAPDLPPAGRSGPSDDVERLAHRPRSLTPPCGAALRRLLGATAAENRKLSVRVRELEGELERTALELARLRMDLRGAVHDALTDPLTGLANRRSFDLELAAVSARATGSSPAHLAVVDIDHFKRINDVHGHDLGDKVLRVVSEIFLANVRRDSLIARLGGDEFGLLLPAANLHYAAGIAIRLCKLIGSRPLVVRGQPEVVEPITLSIGVAGCKGGETGTRWYARADAALYEAKRTGRNRTCVARNGGPGL